MTTPSLSIRAVIIMSVLLPLTITFGSPAVRAGTISVCPEGCDHATIGAAIVAAAAGDSIEIGAGTYNEALVINKSISLRGSAADDVIINGGNRSSTIEVSNPATGPFDPALKVRLERLTITNGSGKRIQTERYGGGLYINGADVTIVDCTVRDNRSFWDGGGIYNDRGIMIVRNSRIMNNIADNSGGGIYNDDAGEMTLEDSIVSSNIARNPENVNPNFETFANGGGVLSRDRTTIRRSLIENNTAEVWGGGVYVFGVGRVTIEDTAIISNSAKEGGGVYTSARVTMIGGRAAENSATDFGGGVYVLGEMTITGAAIEDNEAPSGGGIAVSKGFAPSQIGKLTLERSTVAENRAGLDGGGLFAENGATVTILLSTFSGNRAAFGGGIRESGAASLEIVESTVAANFGGDGAGVSSDVSNVVRMAGTLLANPEGRDCGGSIRSDGHNLDQDGSCEFTRNADISSGVAALGALRDNGGPLRTHMPGPASDAIDSGHPNRCAATDQRGVTRPQDGNGDGQAICDIGAVEREGVEPETATPTVSATPSEPSPTVTPEATPGTPDPTNGIFLPRALKND